MTLDDLTPETSETAESVPAGARLAGRVAVGLIIVEGPTAHNLQFTDAERTKVVTEVQSGLGWLGSASTAWSAGRVTWVYDIKRVTLNVSPNYPTTSYEAMEAPWRDKAMEQLGYGAGHAGVQSYVQGLRARLNTDSAYCAFFTKYPTFRIAYANIAHLVMHYYLDVWTPENIDRIFAHETGHIFGAKDEYGNCDCGGQLGYCRKPNANCYTCAPNGGVRCIMKNNDREMCFYTPFHFGFDVKVPYVRELSPTAAASALREVCLEPVFQGGGSAMDPYVYSQTPAWDTLVPPFSRVTCYVTEGPVP